MKSRNLANTLIAVTCALGWSASASAIEVMSDSAPRFLKQAEVALERSNYDRVVGLLSPRMNQLRRHNYQHRAYAALCHAHLQQLDLDAANKTCHKAVEYKSVNGSDYNNLGVYHYLNEDFETAAVYFKQASSSGPNDDYDHNLDAAVTANARVVTASQ